MSPENEEREQSKTAFDLLFERVPAYELLAKEYIQYWSSANYNDYVYNSCCESCNYLAEVDEQRHLIQIYYGIFSMTVTVIVDAAIALLLKRWGNRARERINQLSPFAIYYHF